MNYLCTKTGGIIFPAAILFWQWREQWSFLENILVVEVFFFEGLLDIFVGGLRFGF